MNSSDGGDPVSHDGRWVGVTLEHRQVCLDADEASNELSYAGILITHYDSSEKVSEAWVPLGVDPSEADDEQLIQQLRGALLWQEGSQPNAASDQDTA
jgi:hypothetical protein